MREILFRGKTKDGRWVYGDLTRRLVDTTWQDILGEYQFAIAGKGEREKTVDFKNKRAEVISCTTVAPATVGQYTGHCDKNGVKIFEGDIVRCIALSNDHHQRGAIVISPVEVWNGNACLSVTYIPIYPFCIDHEIEVIGDIHDNPELIKEKSR